MGSRMDTRTQPQSNAQPDAAQLLPGQLQSRQPCTSCTTFCYPLVHGEIAGNWTRWCAECNCVVRVKICACVRAEITHPCYERLVLANQEEVRDKIGPRAVCSRGWHTTRLPTSNEVDALFVLKHKALQAWRHELKNLVPELLLAHRVPEEIAKNILLYVGFDHPWLGVEGIVTRGTETKYEYKRER